MSPNYGIGDEVYCIDSLPDRQSDMGTGLVAGNKYRVLDMAQCRCGKYSVDVGSWPFSNPLVEMCACERCHEIMRHCCYHARRFIKLDGQLETEKVEEEITA